MAAKQDKIIKIFCVILIFVFAASLRLWNLNQMGRTWDEEFYVDQGKKIVNAILTKDFSNSILYKEPDPPVLAKYIYGLAEHFNLGREIPCNDNFCSYDFTSARLMSVLFSSLTVLLVVLIGWEYVSFFIGITAGIIFSMLPIFLGLSQLVTIESILTFFFTATVYSFLHFLKTFSIRNATICGILLGLAIATKYTNIILIPLFILALYLCRKKTKNMMVFGKQIVLIPLIALMTLFAIWPFPWFHLKYVLSWEQAVRFSEIASHPVPEVFFGRLMPVPIFYYFVYFLITTPFLILVLFLGGLKSISNEKKRVLYVFVLWTLLPFLQSFLNMRQHGLRYIIQIYAPISLISAIGFVYFLKKFNVSKFKFLILLVLISYLFIVLRNLTPYYLDYFNSMVGGVKGVYRTKLFQIGWWGQGVREAALYISNNAKKGSKIGIAISPDIVMPRLSNFNIEKYSKSSKYDYVIVNYYNILREGFDDSPIKSKYKPVYVVSADGAPLVTVYRDGN